MTERNQPETVTDSSNGARSVAGKGAARAGDRRSAATVVRERNDHDAATVLAVVLALAGGDETAEETSAGLRSVWSDPGHRLGSRLHPSPVAWWASAMPR